MSGKICTLHLANLVYPLGLRAGGYRFEENVLRGAWRRVRGPKFREKEVKRKAPCRTWEPTDPAPGSGVRGISLIREKEAERRRVAA